MTSTGAPAELTDALAALRQSRGDTVQMDDIAEVVGALLASVSGDVSGDELQLHGALQDLADYLHSARRELAALNPQEIRESFIPTASDELDAIVEATEKATGEIMDAAEEIEAVMAEVSPEQSERLMGATTRIYEACSFQDITGQRITKVVRVLQDVEARVNAMIQAVDGGGDGTSAAQTPAAPADPIPGDGTPTDEDLLNGPQMADKAMGQDDIDALLNSFD